MARKEEVKLDRRELLMLGLAGASTLVLGKGSTVRAAEEKEVGVERKVIKEAESTIPGFSKIRLREFLYQPGGTSPVRKMPNAMVCECTLGSLEVTNDGRTFTANKGDIWTCRQGGTEGAINKGQAVAIMRVLDLLPA